MTSSERVQRWSVGDLAGRFGLATHVLRHWEDVGLLTPARDGAGRRRYGQDEVVRVAVILRSKAAGMSLEQIAVMLDADAADRHAVLQAHLDDLDRRMQDMERSREMTEHALRCGAHDIATCPRFKAAVTDLVEGKLDAFPTGPEIHAMLG
ncbi:MerR family transcriptional regulator [Nocardioides marmotae]|uniref:MerR family transcriptional regulator n=1 Tax=Nocardioides marmotae TaxID=2663857 RepID=A0A6I3JE19_9ACTN|nr:MerR family transcriptional regulator [Nocardioides marmotae]MCR6032707.1 MerR family transcriptional regulator [Gordonia jinghuaiqii]MBC9732465.1 MerR family transcriptional regulator [Nocardioides marmotae]MTB83584.1 MerR family transcriptional regulator [Nocardioides marmotae]MTB96357.1 MerR family transcriptional regulator [Nocardioides marmotae]QKE03161.1 MerR family transcriptional regulator [Nocardioides marmotae]